MTRINIRMDASTMVARRDGLLDQVIIATDNVLLTLTVGPTGAAAATEAGASLLAAGRRQYIPHTTSMDGPAGQSG